MHHCLETDPGSTRRGPEKLAENLSLSQHPSTPALATPVTAVLHRFGWAVILTAIILVECGILALNGGRCPLTDVAARLPDDRADNFDIYLPNWLAGTTRRSLAL